MSAFDFDPTEAEPSKGSGGPAIPAGKYLQTLVSFEEKDNSGGTGKLREAIWETVSDQYGDATFVGSIVYENINTHHDNETAQRIGREQLSAVCASLLPGVNVKNSDQLIGRVALNTVKLIPEGTVDKGKNGRADYTHTKDKNEITKHEAPDSAGQAAARPAAPPKAAAPVARPAAPVARQAAPLAPSAQVAAPVNGGVPAWRRPRATA
jgi:hypothetical protein